MFSPAFRSGFLVDVDVEILSHLRVSVLYNISKKIFNLKKESIMNRKSLAEKFNVDPKIIVALRKKFKTPWSSFIDIADQCENFNQLQQRIANRVPSANEVACIPNGLWNHD
ncbi:hypothetical protein K9M41_01740 [Candidatus Gracilibacteria bacterium]|nr:hypothetical protein [Candidatus Gracilibacteria bacterium]